ncbi:hypothetical protein D3C72_1037460 [compost metagenome]
MNVKLIDQALDNAAQRLRLAIGDVVGAAGHQMIALGLTGQPHRVNRVLVVGHIHQRIAAARQQHAAVVVHHLRQTRDKHFVVRPKQALWTQNGETGVRV